MSDPLGELAQALLREAQVILDDPTQSEHHPALQDAVDRMNAQLTFWDELQAGMKEIDEQGRLST